MREEYEKFSEEDKLKIIAYVLIAFEGDVQKVRNLIIIFTGFVEIGI